MPKMRVISFDLSFDLQPNSSGSSSDSEEIMSRNASEPPWATHYDEMRRKSPRQQQNTTPRAEARQIAAVSEDVHDGEFAPVSGCVRWVKLSGLSYPTMVLLRHPGATPGANQQGRLLRTTTGNARRLWHHGGLLAASRKSSSAPRSRAGSTAASCQAA